jgi:hypothetical protein
MKTLRTLGLLVTLLASQGLAQSAQEPWGQGPTLRQHTAPASGRTANAEYHVQIAAASMGLSAPAAFGHSLLDLPSGASQEAQPDSAVFLLAGLALLGAVIYRRCSAAADRG